jgi:uncharacterized protein YecE (DUF72 family)
MARIMSLGDREQTPTKTRPAATTQKADSKLPSSERLLSDRLHIGCVSWTIPKGLANQFGSAGSHLTRYAGRFRSVEINSSFYRPHRPATYQRWAETVPADFRFAVKVPKEITHSLRLRDAEQQIGEFVEECAHLGENLVPLLVQLPPSLAFDAETARRFWRQLRDVFRGDIACEPRHPSWFGDAADRMLADFLIARVAADPAVVPHAALPGGDRRLVYFRLHGAPRVYYSAYDSSFLGRTAVALVNSLSNGAKVWCIFDNTAEGAAADNAITLGDQLSIDLRDTTPG